MALRAVAADGIAQNIADGLPELAATADARIVALHLLDTLACALGAELGHGDTAAGVTAIDGIARLTDEIGGPGGATVWATGRKVSLEAAAMRNAVSARYLDFNDTYVSSAIVHPSDVIAVLVAEAESSGGGWQRLVEAVTIAYEVGCRLAEASRLRSNGFEASTLTPLSATAGCAWLMGLPVDETRNALNIACLDAATLRAVRLGRLSHWKAVASARGAVKGWFAASASRAGLRAPDEAFDSEDGFTARVSGRLEIGGGTPRMPRVIIKQYPLQIFIQRPAALAERVYASLIGDTVGCGGSDRGANGSDRGANGSDASGEIADVVVRTFAEAVDLVGAPVRPDLNAESADHSLRFGVAATLVAGRLGPSDVHALVDDPRVRSLAERVRVEASPAHSARFPEQLGADIEVRLRGGRRITAHSDDDESLTTAALRTKFRALTGSDSWSWPWQLAGTPPSTDLDSLLHTQKGMADESH